MECEIGSKVFIIESNRIIREVTIVRKNSDFYVVRFDSNGCIQLRKSRVFSSEEAAKSIFQRIIIFLRHPGDDHHISIGIKNVECLNIGD